MRFLLDENIHPAVAEEAWEQEVDAVSVVELRRMGRSDLEQLELAASQNRILVTRNRADYVYWTRELYHAGRPHAGLLLVGDGLPNDRPETLARTLVRWARARSFGSRDEVAFGAYHVDFLQR
jgi:predicted nuclease of predicted toxin-antitoxin system